MLRWLILIVGFYFGLAFLPKAPVFLTLLAAVEPVPTTLATAISFGAAITAAGLAYVLAMRPGAPLRPPFSWWASLIGAALFGTVISGLFDLFEFMSGQAVSLTNLIIIPVAFVIGEGLYLILRTAWRLVRRGRGDENPADGAEIAVKEHDGPAASPAPSNVLRLAIVLPVYAFIVVVLPQQEDMQRWLRQFDYIHPQTIFWISLGAILVGIAGLFATAFLPTDQPDNASKSMTQEVIFRAFLGLIFGGGLNILGHLFGFGAAGVEFLIVMPVAFAAAELIYRGIHWRLNRDFN